MDAHRASAVASRGEQQRGRTKARTVTDQRSLVARIERAIYRRQNTHGLPLQTLGDGSDPEAVLRNCANDHIHRIGAAARTLMGMDSVVLRP